jgi:glycerate 2-kinase
MCDVAPAETPGRTFSAMAAHEPRQFLVHLYEAAIRAADPRAATRQAVDAIDDLTPTVLVIAVGKGAHAMASGAVDALHSRGIQVANGLVVSHESAAVTHGLEALVADHPVPGDRSFAAADRLAQVASHSDQGSDAIVLVSGGATSLIAAPIDRLQPNVLGATFDALLASGADITLMNAVRKRLLRFGGGRLATMLNSRRVHCLVASDVIGNDVSAIASGPCVPDSLTARDTRERARAAGIWNALPDATRTIIDAMVEGRIDDTPRADHPRFASTTTRVILDRQAAAGGAQRAALDAGAMVEVVDNPLFGEAAVAGSRIAQHVLSQRRIDKSACTIWTGETTVMLDARSGRGGRCQELALACAMTLDSADGITILAAGTDGRDGPTDAAGAIIDGSTCSAMRDRGIDPSTTLLRHDSYNALDSVGALLKTGSTGTNVNDIVISLVSPRP